MCDKGTAAGGHSMIISLSSAGIFSSMGELYDPTSPSQATKNVLYPKDPTNFEGQAD